MILIFGKNVVFVAIYPSFTGLCRYNDGVPGRMEMFGHVLVGRAVAAQRNAARLAGPQVHPLIAGFNALFAYQLAGLPDRF
jgi:hypothetical protein